MKIKYEGNTTYDLAGGLAARECPFNLDISGQGVTQEAAFLRAANAAIFGRKNWKSAINFTVVHKASTVAEAFQYMLQLMAVLQEDENDGRLYVYPTDSAAPWILFNAVGSVQGRIKGVSVIMQYSFTGSKWSL